jgi:hypothetical protein
MRRSARPLERRIYAAAKNFVVRPFAWATANGRKWTRILGSISTALAFSSRIFGMDMG